MHPLLLRLAALRRRLWFVNGWRGLCAVAALVMGAAVFVGVADYGVHLPSLVRALALVGLLAGAGVVAYRYLLQPFWTPADDLSLALRVEAHFPDLNDALGSAVQFLQAEDEPDPTGSKVLRKKAIEQSEKLAEGCEFTDIVNHRGMWWLTLAAMVAFLAAGYFLFRHRQLSGIAVARLTDPFGQHPWTLIEVAGCPHKIAVGQPYDVRAFFDGIVPGKAIIEVDSLGVVSKNSLDVKRDAAGKAMIHARADMTQHTQHKGEFKFRILANDGVYPPGRNAWHKVEVLPPPRLALLNGLPSPQIELYYPAYTDLRSPVRLAPGTWQIDVPAGTKVILRAAADRDLDQAWVELVPDNTLVRLSSFLTPLGAGQALELVGGVAAGASVWSRFPAAFAGDQKTFAIEFTPWVNGSYVLHLEDADGLVKEHPSYVRVKPDPLPTVHLLRPGSTMSVLPDAEISFQTVVEDSLYAIRSVFIEYRRRDAEGKSLDDGPQRLDFYDHDFAGRLLPRLAGLWSPPLAALPNQRLRPQRLELASRWALRNRFKEGEVIQLQVCADDFCDLYLDRQPGRSHEVEIRIVGKGELAKLLDEGLIEAQQELVRVQQMQEEAINLVKEIQKNKDKAGQKELDQLAEAQQMQKQVQDRIGNTPDEGLRKQLAKLNQIIKDNKLPSSEVQDLIGTMKQELERLAQEDLQQIEPNLAEARKDLAGTQKQKEQPKGKAPLDKAGDLQKEVKKTLDDLAKQLDPFASVQVVKGITRNMLVKQTDLQKETDQIKTRQDLIDPKTPNADKLKAEMQKDLGKIGEAQNNLAQKAQELMDMIAKAQAKRAEQGDKDSAAKLKEAGKIAKEGKLPDKMREAGQNLAKPEPLVNKAIGEQQETIKNLEKMLTALEQGKKDDLERLAKKQKNADQVQKDIAKLAKDQERLQKKVKDAQKIEDPKLREQELKRLAEEQKKLTEEAKEKARDLARLNEERASRDLDRAAQEMDQAAEKLADGQNPEEQQKQALERLEEAKAKLQDFQEELAREQLARIADRLQGLKERQDGALERTKDLHKKVLAKSKWSVGLLDTLGGDQLSQNGLAKEADSLREKIKEAKVFEHILSRAAKDMEEAAKIMGQRRKVGIDRQAALFEKEKLADENAKDEATRKLQQQASQRLQRLLDALKNEPPKIAQRPKKQDNDPKGGGEPQGGMRPGDGIPPMAQLKALRAEQLEVNERTKDFAQRHPDVNNLDDAQRGELTQIQADQERIRQLFGEMTAPAEKKGAEQ